MDRYRKFCRELAYLEQHPYESTYDYFERTKYYVNNCPNHGFRFHELINHFLDGMLPDERDMMDTMAGGSIMDRTPIEVWHLIEDRAADTRPYAEYLKLSLEEAAYQQAHQLALDQRVAEIAKYKAELDKEIAYLNEKLEEIAKNKQELKSAPEPVQSSSDDEEVILSMKDQADEEIMDEELQVVPMINIEDVPTEEEISPQCSDIIIEQNTVIACNPIILHVSNLVLSSHVQIGAIQKALLNNQVWGSLEKVTIHIPMVRNPMRMQTSEKFLDGLCINWKTRKKDMRGSLEKIDTHTHKACATRQTLRMEKLPEGLHRTWKRRKKCKHIFLDNKCSMFSVYMQKSRSTFGWKPGWSSWRNISHRVTKKSRRFWAVEDKSFHQCHRSNLRVRKFDGVHPWAPNIC